MVRFGAERLEVSGRFGDERGLNIQSAITLQRGGKKHVSYNGKRMPRQADYVGKFPIVVFSPESHRVTSGSPGERRRFIDMLLCQGSAAYLADLQEYSRILRQRNAVLAARNRINDEPLLTVWDEALVEAGSRIITARAHFFQTISARTGEIYRRVDTAGGGLRLIYESQIGEGANVRETFSKLLGQRRNADWRRGQTSVGPHRDDMAILIGKVNLRSYGSRGEHKSVLMALKLIEAEYLHEKKQTAPMVIMDDLFSELDEERARRSVELFAESSQLFVSSIKKPEVSPVPHDLFLEIENGTIISEKRQG